MNPPLNLYTFRTPTTKSRFTGSGPLAQTRSAKDKSPREEIPFTTGYKAILDRVAKIDPSDYARTRKFISGAVSYLSPYNSRGVISLPQVAKAALDYAIQMDVLPLAQRRYTSA